MSSITEFYPNHATGVPKEPVLNRVYASFCWAWMDISCRYRRSVIGPFWETINVLVMILGMSYMSSAIFGGKVASNLPYIGIGIILWSLLSTMVCEGAGAFVQHKDLIRNAHFSIDIYIGRVVFRTLITTAHHLLLYVLGVIFFHIPLSGITLLAVPGIVLTVINSYWVVGFLGLICARFRDLEMIIKNFMQLVFFVTPVFWNYHTISAKRHLLIALNPFFYFIQSVRAPLLGETPPLDHYAVMVGITVAGYGLFFLAYRRLRSELAFFV